MYINVTELFLTFRMKILIIGHWNDCGDFNDSGLHVTSTRRLSLLLLVALSCCYGICFCSNTNSPMYMRYMYLTATCSCSSCQWLILSGCFFFLPQVLSGLEQPSPCPFFAEDIFSCFKISGKAAVRLYVED